MEVKRYKFPAWTYIFPILFFFGGVVMALLSINKIGYCVAGIGMMILCAGIIWLLKHPVIEIDEEELVFLDPVFRQFSKRIKWSHVIAIYTLEDPSGEIGQYVIPMFRSNNIEEDNLINSKIVSKDRKEKEKNLMKLIKQRKIYRIPPVQNYYKLLEEICRRSTNAVIDEDTKDLLVGKGRVTHMIFSKGVRSFFIKIRNLFVKK